MSEFADHHPYILLFMVVWVTIVVDNVAGNYIAYRDRRRK